MDVMAHLSRAVEPGTKFNYSTGETQVAGEILYGAIKRPLADYLSDKIWKPYGMEAEATWWLDSPGGLEIAGSGLFWRRSVLRRPSGQWAIWQVDGFAQVAGITGPVDLDVMKKGEVLIQNGEQNSAFFVVRRSASALKGRSMRIQQSRVGVLSQRQL